MIVEKRPWLWRRVRALMALRMSDAEGARGALVDGVGLAVDVVSADLEQDGGAVPVGKVIGTSGPAFGRLPGRHASTGRRQRGCSRSDVD